MKSLYSPKLLKARIEQIELPPKEKVLPQGVTPNKETNRKIVLPIYIKKIVPAAVAAVLAVVIGLQGAWYLVGKNKQVKMLIICDDDNYN